MEPLRNRHRLDFFTNPTYAEVLAALDEMMRRETATLRTTARSDDHAKTQVQVGIVDGIERVMLRLTNMRDEALKTEEAVP